MDCSQEGTADNISRCLEGPRLTACLQLEETGHDQGLAGWLSPAVPLVSCLLGTPPGKANSRGCGHWGQGGAGGLGFSRMGSGSELIPGTLGCSTRSPEHLWARGQALLRDSMSAPSASSEGLMATCPSRFWAVAPPEALRRAGRKARHQGLS